MRTLDKFETLVRDAQPSFQVMGNPATSDYALIATPDLPLSDIELQAMLRRGMYWIGVVGLIEGVPRSALDENLDNGPVGAVARAFLACVTSKPRPEATLPDDAGVKELDALYALIDPRPA